jgi:hypothetical protein
MKFEEAISVAGGTSGGIWGLKGDSEGPGGEETA